MVFSLCARRDLVAAGNEPLKTGNAVRVGLGFRGDGLCRVGIRRVAVATPDVPEPILKLNGDRDFGRRLAGLDDFDFQRAALFAQHEIHHRRLPLARR